MADELILEEIRGFGSDTGWALRGLPGLGGLVADRQDEDR